MEESGSPSSPKTQIKLFFLITIPIAWIFWIPMILINLSIILLSIPTIILSTLGGLSPLAALYIVGKLTGQPLLDRIIKSIRYKDLTVISVLLPVFIAPLITICSNVIGFILQYNVEFQVFNPIIFSELGLFILPVIAVQFTAGLITSPLFEEPGWRGFAFTELSKRWSRIITSLVIGSYWWLWHQGMNLAFGIYPSIYSYLDFVLMSFLIDSVFKLSQGNVLSAMLAHQSFGTTLIFFWAIADNWLTIPVKIITLVILALAEKK